MEISIDKKFDEQFKSIQPLKWLPWIGKNYTKLPQGKKLLIVGESHYIPEDEEAEGYEKATFTREFIAKEGLKQFPWYNNSPTNPLIRNTEKALFLEKNPTDENKQKLWYSSAFINLVQRLLPSRKERPNDNDKDEGWKIFLSIVDIIQPDTCIILGKSSYGRLGYYLNTNETGWIKNDSEFKAKENINLSKNGYRLKLIFIKHPSSYFSWESWGVFIDKHMNEYTTWLHEK